jgi:glycogen operon protein
MDDNHSWNHGVEGPGGDALLLGARRRSIRNLLATELLAAGVPMINAGDELGRTQQGNNNAYCQDNEISWVDWDLEPWQVNLLATTRFLSGLRVTHPVLGQRSFFTGRPARQDGLADLRWFAADGQPMGNDTWQDPHTRTLTMFLDGTHIGGESLLIVFHGGAQSAEVTLPARGDKTTYLLLWDSAWDRPRAPSGMAAGPVTLTAASIRVYSVVR